MFLSTCLMVYLYNEVWIKGSSSILLHNKCLHSHSSWRSKKRMRLYRNCRLTWHIWMSKSAWVELMILVRKEVRSPCLYMNYKGLKRFLLRSIICLGCMTSLTVCMVWHTSPSVLLGLVTIRYISVKSIMLCARYGRFEFFVHPNHRVAAAYWKKNLCIVRLRAKKLERAIQLMKKVCVHHFREKPCIIKVPWPIAYLWCACIKNCYGPW